jgi:hypothetical protein
MSPRRHPNRLGFVHCFLVVSIGSGWLLTGMAAGQDADPPKAKAASAWAPVQRPAATAEAKPATPAAPEDVKLMEVYRLRHVDFQVFVSMIREALPDCTVGFNDKSNSLIVFATREDHDRLKELLERLDVPPDPDQAKLMVVYHLRHVDGETVGRWIAEVLPECRIDFGNQTNSLIAYATREDHDRIAELLQTLDVAPEPSQIKVFSLVNNQAAETAEVLLKLMGDKKANISVDQRTNSIIASGTPESLAEMEALLLRLDESQAHEVDESANYQVRVVWLVSGLGEGAAPSQDLKGVVEELAKVGAVGLQQVCQVTVSATADGEFKVQCSPRLDQDSVALEVTGKLSHREGRASLEIALEAKTETVPAEKGPVPKDRSVSFDVRQLVNVETAIRLPDGHFAVLGATPMEHLTSAFVVQVVPGEK